MENVGVKLKVEIKTAYVLSQELLHHRVAPYFLSLSFKLFDVGDAFLEEGCIFAAVDLR